MTKKGPPLRDHFQFDRGTYVALEYIPAPDVVFSGVRSVYVDGLGRIHICIGIERNKTKAKKILKESALMRKQLLDAMSVKL